jgi:hypothetical protein
MPIPRTPTSKLQTIPPNLESGILNFESLYSELQTHNSELSYHLPASLHPMHLLIGPHHNTAVHDAHAQKSGRFKNERGLIAAN